ncbi:hypothetical protein BUBS_255 [Bacillus phage Bubs]|uniref:hypothetical protein n=1 Tax=Bacillus phage Nemo TaxID=1805950 RepID=UPI0007A77488|nr:hypothetical protein BI006_gp254 [Bacillus phage Nemo]AMW63770.1 hypothetical protein NEMO_254 [Bacillus phage Nemo]ASR78524.1 hypothetical protein BUBS_255 [Bacillus phage Bubs]AXQ67356.1 hypothetical protein OMNIODEOPRIMUS_252 [Bacillus phage OmnioDeoPrimus]
MRQQQLEEMVELLTKERDEARNQVDILTATMKNIARRKRWVGFYSEMGEVMFPQQCINLYKEQLRNCADNAKGALDQAGIPLRKKDAKL